MCAGALLPRKCLNIACQWEVEINSFFPLCLGVCQLLWGFVVVVVICFLFFVFFLSKLPYLNL